MSEPKTFIIENAELIFRNFSGAEGKYNREGDRNFSVVIYEEEIAGMLAEGWNVRRLDPREDGDVGTAYVQIAVSFKYRPPNITLISSKARTKMTEDSIEILDWAEFKTVDIIARAYEWDVNGKTGIKAYLQTMFATLHEDPLELKYAVASEDVD